MSVSLINGHIDDDVEMTDNEIIKALECCAEIGENDCQNCPYFNDVSCRCRNYENLKDALDLINRQKAEIEEWKKILESRHRVIDSLEDSIIGLPDQIRAEAVKKFAERLHDLIHFDWNKIHKQIDNLVKEMVGAESGN